MTESLLQTIRQLFTRKRIEKQPSGDVVGRLMEIGCALRFMSDKYEDGNDYGPAKLLGLLANDVMAAAEQLDDEDWKPTRSI